MKYLNLPIKHSLLLWLALSQLCFASIKTRESVMSFKIVPETGAERWIATLSDHGLQIGGDSPSGNLVLNGMVFHGTQSISQSGNLLTHDMVFADSSGNDLMLNLPTPSSALGRKMEITKTSAENKVYLMGNVSDASGLERILTMSSDNTSTLHLSSNGSKWYVTGAYGEHAFGEIASDNLVAHWRLDELSGNVMADSISGGSNLIIKGTPNSSVGQTGVSGQAVTMGDPLTVYMLSDGASKLSGSQQMTFSGWFDLQNLRSYRYIAGLANVSVFPGSDNDYVWRIRSTTSPTIKFGFYDGNHKNIDFSDDLESGGYQHIVITADNAQANVYVNGVFFNSIAINGLLDKSSDSNYQLMINHADDNGHKMIVDDLRVYDRALNSEEIKAIYDQYQN